MDSRAQRCYREPEGGRMNSWNDADHEARRLCAEFVARWKAQRSEYAAELAAVHSWENEGGSPDRAFIYD